MDHAFISVSHQLSEIWPLDAQINISWINKNIKIYIAIFHLPQCLVSESSDFIGYKNYFMTLIIQKYKYTFGHLSFFNLQGSPV